MGLFTPVQECCFMRFVRRCALVILSCAVTYTNNSSPSQTFDMVANGGETRITILAGGGMRTWVDFMTFSDEWDSQVTVSGNILTSVPVEAGRDTRIWVFTLLGPSSL